MDQKLKTNLILVGVIFILVIIGYYTMSPYQNCMRKEDNGFFCSKNTDW